MKRIIYDYDNPHIVGKSKSSFPLAKVIVAIIVISLVVALVYVLFFKKTAHSHACKEYFAVIMGEYNDENTAYAAAEEMKSKGGGGYVCEGEKFGVVACVYQNEADADAVAERYGAKVVATGKYTLTADLGSDEKSLGAVRLCSLPETLIDEVYELARALDGDEISSEAAECALDGIIEDFNESKSELDELHKIFFGDRLLDGAEKMYDSVANEFDRECSFSTSSRLKYILGSVTFIYKNFLISIT